MGLVAKLGFENGGQNVNELDLECTIKKENKIIIFVIFGIVLLYPYYFDSILIYLPQLFIGVICLFMIIKMSLVKPVVFVLFFAIYMGLESFFFEIAGNNDVIIRIAASSLRLFYPFIGLVVGSLFSRKIGDRSFLYIILIFLIVEAIISYLQMYNTGFRIWSYNFYRPDDSAQQYINNFIYLNSKRVIGTIGNPNVFGTVVVIFNSFILIMIKNIKWQRLIIIVSIVLSSFIIISTQSRTGIVLLIFSILFILFNKYKGRRINSLYFVFMLVLVIFLLLFIQFQTNREISLSALDSRLQIWRIQISYMYDMSKMNNFFTSLFGIGFYKTRELGTFDNQFIKIFVSSGFIGLFIYLKVVIEVFKSVINIKSTEEKKILGILIVFLWVFGSFVMEYQENFKLSIISFIIIGYVIYSNIHSRISLEESNYDLKG